MGLEVNNSSGDQNDRGFLVHYVSLSTPMLIKSFCFDVIMIPCDGRMHLVVKSDVFRYRSTTRQSQSQP